MEAVMAAEVERTLECVEPERHQRLVLQRVHNGNRCLFIVIILHKSLHQPREIAGYPHVLLSLVNLLLLME